MDARVLSAQPGDVLVVRMPFPMDTVTRMEARAEILKGFEAAKAPYVPPVIFLDERMHLGLYQEKP